MRVTALQHDIVWEQPEQNFARLAPRIAAATAAGAGLVVLTEMYSTGFSMASDRIAEPPDGPSTTFLREQAATTGAWVCGSVPTRTGRGLPVNRFVLAGPGGDVHHYDKLHPFTYGGEDRSYAAGGETVTFDVEGLRITPFICYDLRFADDFWAVAEHTDAYVVVANWPVPRHAHWAPLLQARAIENQAFVVGANRVGAGNGLDYAGGSAIIDPWGEVLAVADDGEQSVTADVDADRVRSVRDRYPFLRDRRARP